MNTLESLTWIAVTLMAYGIATIGYKKSKAHPCMLPVVTGSAMVLTALIISDTSYTRYINAVSPLLLLIGPATVALALPLIGQVKRLRTIWLPITVALAVGSLVAIGSAILIAWALGAPSHLIASLAPKSTTMPIALGLSTELGGMVALAAIAVLVTGVSATMLSGPILRLVSAHMDDEVIGFSLGLTAHAIGTARAIQISETAGAYAAMGMGLNGLITTLFMLTGTMAMKAMGYY